MEFLIYGLLALATSAYAIVLERVKPFIEPDLNWLEVAIGFAICMASPMAIARVVPGMTWEIYESRVWIAFIVGGFPIVIWQFYRGRRVATDTRIEAQRLLQKKNHADTTDTLAEQRRTQSPRGNADR